MEQIRHIQALAVSLLQIGAVVAGGWAAVVSQKTSEISQFWSLASAVLLVVSIGALAITVGRIRQPSNSKVDAARKTVYLAFQIGLTTFALGVVATAIMAVKVLD